MIVLLQIAYRIIQKKMGNNANFLPANCYRLTGTTCHGQVWFADEGIMDLFGSLTNLLYFV